MKKSVTVLFLVLAFLPAFLAISVFELSQSSQPTSWSNNWMSQDGNWNVTIAVQYPKNTLSGASMPINVKLILTLAPPFQLIKIDSATVQIRDPLQLDPNSTLVLQWRTLSYFDLGWSGNYSAPTTLQEQVTMTAIPPPAVTLLDAVSVSRRFALNVDVIGEAYRSPTDFDYVEFSFLDSISLYSSQLSRVYLTSTFLTFQLLSATTVMLLFLAFSLRHPKKMDKPYGRELERFRIERSVESLKSMRARKEISDTVYADLEREYISQLDEIT